MSKLNRLLGIRSGYESSRTLFMVSLLFLTIAATSCLYAQTPPCMITCGTQPVACDQANNLLCGTFTGTVNILVQDPRTPDQPRAITSIDLALVLDDNGPGNGDWNGYVSPAKSFVFPIRNPDDPPPSQIGPIVVGSNQSRMCTVDNPCVLASESFMTPVSGTNARRQFVLVVTQIVYQDETARQTPRALIGFYAETIQNYTVGRDIQVNGIFRLERSLLFANVP